MDRDIQDMNVDELRSELQCLRSGIRQHRDEKGDDRCLADDNRLYGLLPEKLLANATVGPDFTPSCIRFKANRTCPKHPDQPIELDLDHARYPAKDCTHPDHLPDYERLLFAQGVFISKLPMHKQRLAADLMDGIFDFVRTREPGFFDVMLLRLAAFGA